MELPAELPQSFICDSKFGGLPPECFGEPDDPPLPRRWVENFGTCVACAIHCDTFTMPQPCRLFDQKCSLCWQFDRTRNAVRRLRPGTIHQYNFMKQLEQMEHHACALVEADPWLVHQVMPNPVIVNEHGVAVAVDDPGLAYSQRVIRNVYGVLVRTRDVPVLPPPPLPPPQPSGIRSGYPTGRTQSDPLPANIDPWVDPLPGDSSDVGIWM